MSLSVVSGNRISLNIIIKELCGMSPAFAIFISNSLINKALFSSMPLVRGLIGFYGSIKGGL
jgi:hypothetical protein